MWEISVQKQVLAFVWALVLGAIFCFIYDIISSMRRAYKWGYWIIFISDVLMWVLCAFATFIFLISQTNGEIRSYVLFGEMLGFICWRIVFSKFVVRFFVFIFTRIRITCNYGRKIFYLFFEKLEHFILKFFRKATYFLISALKTAKKLLHYVYGLLYTNNNNVNMENNLDETKTKT